jgi:predicted ABC-type ATPase
MGRAKQPSPATPVSKISGSFFPAVRLLSPDEAAKVYYASNPGITVDAANLWAANAIPAQVIRCIDAGQNVAVETVLSSDCQRGRMRSCGTGWPPLATRLATRALETFALSNAR